MYRSMSARCEAACAGLTVAIDQLTGRPGFGRADPTLNTSAKHAVSSYAHSQPVRTRHLPVVEYTRRKTYHRHDI